MTVGRIPSVEGGIQPTIVTTKGDIIVATGNASLVRQGVGANGTVLTANSAQADGVEWVAPDPLTTKGDLFTYSTTEARLGVGANDTVLTADSTAATGLKWATPASGGMTLLSTTTLSGASTTISSISGSYTNLQIYIYGVTGAGSDSPIRLWFNGDTGGGFTSGVKYDPTGGAVAIANAADRINLYSNATSRTNATNAAAINISNYSNTSGKKPLSIYGYCIKNGVADGIINQAGYFQGTAAVTSVSFDYGGTNTFAGGTVLIYGVK